MKKWFIPAKTVGAEISGYYPSWFDWDVSTLLSRKTLLGGVRLIISGSSASMSRLQLGRLPVPVFGTELIKKRSYVNVDLTRWMRVFEFVPVEIGSIGDGGRYFKYDKAFVAVPKPGALFDDIRGIDSKLHAAVVGGVFVIDAELRNILTPWLHGRVKFSPCTGRVVKRKIARPINYDEYFQERKTIEHAELEERIFSFICVAMDKFKRKVKKKVSMILIDVNPEWGSMSISFSTKGPGKEGRCVSSMSHPDFAEALSKQLFGSCQFVKVSAFLKVLRQAAARVSRQEFVQEIAGASGLKVYYCIHESDRVELLFSVDSCRDHG